MRHPTLRLHLLIMYFNWFSTAFIMYGPRPLLAEPHWWPLPQFNHRDYPRFPRQDTGHGACQQGRKKVPLCHWLHHHRRHVHADTLHREGRLPLKLAYCRSRSHWELLHDNVLCYPLHVHRYTAI